MQASCSLSTDQLTCVRGGRLLFANVDIALSAGSALQVVGANGCGKTSLMRIVAGLLRPFSGRVHRHGTLGLIDQKSALDEQVTLRRALAFWAALDGNRLSEADIDRLGLSELGDVPVRYLSTGQQKRAALARLLGQKAQIWLLDEPLNGLDVDGTRLVERLVAEHCERGGLALVASHQPIDLPGNRVLALEDYVPPADGYDGAAHTDGDE